MRKVYFSFHYERDIWRANQVRNSGVVTGSSAAGFEDGSIWEEAKTKGDRALKRLIIDGMEDTEVTVVLLGQETAGRKWVKFEIKESIERKNALVGVRIHRLKDQRGRKDTQGHVPKALTDRRVEIYDWEGQGTDLGEWVEEAYVNQISWLDRFFR